MTDVPYFNYRDKDAVVHLVKKVMRKTFPDYEDDTNEWGAFEERRWRAFCDRMGGRFTEFPDIGIQPQEIKDLFRENEAGIESSAHDIIDPSLRLSDFVIQSRDTKSPYYVPDQKPSQADHSDVNWSPSRGTVEGYKHHPLGRVGRINNVPVPKTENRIAIRRKVRDSLAEKHKQLDNEPSNDEVAKALIVR